MRGSMKTVVTGVLLCGLLGGGCLDELGALLPDDGFGLNNDFDSAYDLTGESSPAAGTLFSYPEDWFVLTTTSVGLLDITCTPQAGVSDVNLVLYDSALTEVATGTDVAGTLTINFDGGGSGAPIDTYYILVEYTGSVGGDAYVLTWTFTPNP